MKKLIIIFFILIILGALFYITYDVYSYHIAAYYSLKLPFSEIFNSKLYFDRFPDYPPLGVYINIFTGKVFSFLYPLSYNNVKLLFVYKFISILFLVLLFSIFQSTIKTKEKFYEILFFVLFFPVIILLGETDSILIFLIMYSIAYFEKHLYKEGLFLLIINLAIKQTGLFISIFILFYYFILIQNKKKFISYFILIGSSLFFIICSPFIVSGNFLQFISDFFHNSLNVISPLSIKAFNLLALPKDAFMIDFNYKPFIASYKTYSILILLFSIFIINIKFRKMKIFEILPVFTIIWYNFQVGLHSHHIIYPAFFIFLYSALYNRNKIISYIYIFLTIADIMLNSSIITMAVFKFPYMKYYYIQLFSVIQIISGGIFIYNSLKKDIVQDIRIDVLRIDYKTMYIVIIIFVLLTVFLPGRIKNEQELLSYTIENKLLIDYSKDRFIQMDIYQENPFLNFLGIRMSDKSYFKFSPLFNKIQFYAVMEYGDSGQLIINNDTFNISKNKQYIEYNIKNDSIVSIYSMSKKKFSQIVLYYLNYE